LVRTPRAACAAFSRPPSDCPRPQLRQRFDQRERLLELRRITLERLELLAFRLQHSEELLDLNLLCDGDAAQLLDVSLASQIHALSRSY
jgi:hypothetical protein